MKLVCGFLLLIAYIAVLFFWGVSFLIFWLIFCLSTILNSGLIGRLHILFFGQCTKKHFGS